MAKAARTSGKDIDDQIEKIAEMCVKQIALLHLPRNFKNDDLEPSDIDTVVDLSVTAVQMIVLSVLDATMIGQLGRRDDDEQTEAA